MIEFATGPSPREVVESRTGHLVVCEQGHELSEVIAANYAYALGAGLVIVPNVPTDVADAILETFYSLYDHPDYSARELRQDLRARLRSFCGALSLPASPSLTFITNKLPFGFGYSEAPSTHLFTYPDLGMAIINGFASAASNKDETVAAVVVDPGQTPAPEIATAAELLAQRGTFVRGYRGPAANVRDVSQMIEHFPYDLLIIATHCGDAPGYRWTHEFKDAEGRTRQLVVDIALGIAQSEDDPDVVQLTRFERFHSLDGVLWNDPEKAKKIVVGSAIVEYMRQAHDTQELKPISKETINRVLGSAALRMYDNNLIALPTAALANYRTPIIFNNACVSWHELSERKGLHRHTLAGYGRRGRGCAPADYWKAFRQAACSRTLVGPTGGLSRSTSPPLHHDRRLSAMAARLPFGRTARNFEVVSRGLGGLAGTAQQSRWR
ncbi:hypothetical protein [Rhizobium leguminosarum]|uniref:Uncharacterized protein n=1 Tax=Rhizobium leguminosarum TaxID=384 RepID=A0A6P0BAY6_RHILE|nr:hypothetical protein [Rhizobium leguminosarum]MBY5439586.1 hypothetical protein [Rhizobium leguminosarum]NEI37090.1 hypothetical protein [Rhizobium leguminosarum]NEI43566.1 hypothetical protein [Rhizobium leguminosarum]